MIIEFVGPPGAGKTTIAQELAQLTGLSTVTLDGYRTPDGRLLTSREVQIHRWRSLVAQPRLAREVVVCARREGRGLALSWMINLARRNGMMRSLQGRNIVLEEGTLSSLCLAMAARSQPWDVRPTVSQLTHGDRIVVVTTDADTAVQRIQSRKGILSDRDAEELYELVSRYLSALARVTALLNPAPIVVRSDQPPAVVAGFLHETLRASL